MIVSKEWEIVEYGPSFGGAQLLTIKETLNQEVSGNDYEGNLSKRSTKVSKVLKHNIGIGHWQVLFIKGKLAKKLFCSRTYFCRFIKKDGLQAIIWVNRFVSKILYI